MRQVGAMHIVDLSCFVDKAVFLTPLLTMMTMITFDDPQGLLQSLCACLDKHKGRKWKLSCHENHKTCIHLTTHSTNKSFSSFLCAKECIDSSPNQLLRTNMT